MIDSFRFILFYCSLENETNILPVEFIDWLIYPSMHLLDSMPRLEKASSFVPCSLTKRWRADNIVKALVIPSPDPPLHSSMREFSIKAQLSHTSRRVYPLDS